MPREENRKDGLRATDVKDAATILPNHHRLSRVRIVQVTKLFGPTPALRGATLELAAGQITVLTGPNGAGKSTLLNIIGTALRPTRGHVDYFDGTGVLLTRTQVRAQLGWVSHTSHCYAELSGKQNVELAAELQGVGIQNYERVAARVGLAKFALRPLSTLSRGQTQRVALARALVHDPNLLLLDEPWTGLDQNSARLLETIVLEEAERGALVAVVSHEPGLVERLSARRVHIAGGQVQSDSNAVLAGGVGPQGL